jgi:hypothetical protein
VRATIRSKEICKWSAQVDLKHQLRVPKQRAGNSKPCRVSNIYSQTSSKPHTQRSNVTSCCGILECKSDGTVATSPRLVSFRLSSKIILQLPTNRFKSDRLPAIALRCQKGPPDAPGPQASGTEREIKASCGFRRSRSVIPARSRSQSERSDAEAVIVDEVIAIRHSEKIRIGRIVAAGAVEMGIAVSILSPLLPSFSNALFRGLHIATLTCASGRLRLR